MFLNLRIFLFFLNFFCFCGIFFEAPGCAIADFSGFGRFRRICLFDTLLPLMSEAKQRIQSGSPKYFKSVYGIPCHNKIHTNNQYVYQVLYVIYSAMYLIIS